MDILTKLPDLMREDSSPLYKKLYHVLSEYIRRNQFKPGDMIPSEKALEERYGVSRVTVRQAIQKMETENLVHRVPGKGTFVKASGSTALVWGKGGIDRMLAEQGYAMANLVLQMGETEPPDWATDMYAKGESEIFYIRRLKTINDQTFALEIRLFPLEVANRFTAQEMGTRYFLGLLGKDPNTEVTELSYSFSPDTLSDKHAREMNVESGTQVLIRNGIYYSAAYAPQNKPVMISRLYFLPQVVEVRYVFSKAKGGWEVFLKK